VIFRTRSRTGPHEALPPSRILARNSRKRFFRHFADQRPLGGQRDFSTVDQKKMRSSELVNWPNA
jgi:hypothetical protein